jgi:hypothetical protein
MSLNGSLKLHLLSAATSLGVAPKTWRPLQVTVPCNRIAWALSEAGIVQVFSIPSRRRQNHAALEAPHFPVQSVKQHVGQASTELNWNLMQTATKAAIRV